MFSRCLCSLHQIPEIHSGLLQNSLDPKTFSTFWSGPPSDFLQVITTPSPETRAPFLTEQWPLWPDTFWPHLETSSVAEFAVELALVALSVFVELVPLVGLEEAVFAFKAQLGPAPPRRPQFLSQFARLRFPAFTVVKRLNLRHHGVYCGFTLVFLRRRLFFLRRRSGGHVGTTSCTTSWLRVLCCAHHWPFPGRIVRRSLGVVFHVTRTIFSFIVTWTDGKCFF